MPEAHIVPHVLTVRPEEDDGSSEQDVDVVFGPVSLPRPLCRLDGEWRYM